jgi:hypothetical protein
MFLKILARSRAIRFTMLLVAAVCFGQTAENNARTNGDDLKAIRASLERLVQLTQEIDKSQKAILALQQIQLYEFRLQALESRDDALAERESQLSARNVTLERAARDTASGIGPTGLPGTSADSGLRKETADQLDANQRSLDTARAKKEQIEGEIASLRARIESLQKTLAASGVEK